MKVMSEGLQKVAGDRLRNILGIMTKNRVTGVLTGIVITALIQSSSASTVMVVSFVNAGLMSLAQSMAVIFGANVGTTVTTWIISAFSFEVSISDYSILLLAVGVGPGGVKVVDAAVRRLAEEVGGRLLGNALDGQTAEAVLLDFNAGGA